MSEERDSQVHRVRSNRPSQGTSRGGPRSGGTTATKRAGSDGAPKGGTRRGDRSNLGASRGERGERDRDVSGLLKGLRGGSDKKRDRRGVDFLGVHFEAGIRGKNLEIQAGGTRSSVNLETGAASRAPPTVT